MKMVHFLYHSMPYQTFLCRGLLLLMPRSYHMKTMQWQKNLKYAAQKNEKDKHHERT